MSSEEDKFFFLGRNPYYPSFRLFLITWNMPFVSQSNVSYIPGLLASEDKTNSGHWECLFEEEIFFEWRKESLSFSWEWYCVFKLVSFAGAP